MAHKMSPTLNALEARIVAALTKRYPMTTDELGEELSVRRDTLDRALKGLAVKGVLELEPLPDKTYIRLLVLGADSAGKPSAEGGATDRDSDSIAYR